MLVSCIDLVGVSPIFHTEAKRNGTALSEQLLWFRAHGVQRDVTGV